MPYGPFPHGWPYSNFHDLNLDWIISVIRELETKITQFVALNTVKYANPFQWNIASQYAKNTLVIDPQIETVYLSVQPVPMGVQITDTDYWTKVASIAGIYDQLISAITNTVYDKFGIPAIENIEKNSLVWINNVLYKCISPVSAGQNILSASFVQTNLDTEFEGLVEQYKQIVENTTSDLNERISNIIADGTQTEGNTELIDIRIGADGEVYQTAGDAVRRQVGEIKGDLDNLKSSIVDKIEPTNKFNLQDVTKGCILYLTDGNEHDNDNFVTSGKISVTVGDIVRLYVSNNLTLATNFESLCCYDINGKYLGGTKSVTTFKIPYDKASYIRFSVGSRVYTNRMLTINTIPTEYSDYFTPYYELKKDEIDIYENWQNKKILVLGDSILSLKFQNVSNALIELLKPSKYVNIAVPGATWCEPQDSVLDGNPVSENPPSNHIANQVQKIINNKDDSTYSDFDYIIIGAGTNDFAGWFNFENVTEEQLESYFVNESGYINVDTITRKNIIGAMRYVIEKIRYLYPNVVIFISLPIQSAYGYGVQRNPDYLKKKCELMKRICIRMGEQYIETNLCGIYAKNETKDSNGLDLRDGLHPNEHGAKKEARYIASKIAEYFLSSN